MSAPSVLKPSHLELPDRHSPSALPAGPAPSLLITEVAALRGEVRGLGAEVRALGGEVRRQGRTDWPAVLTAGGLAATALAGLGTLALDPLKADAARMRTEVHALAGEVRAHGDNGHPATNARLEALERDGRP